MEVHSGDFGEYEKKNLTILIEYITWSHVHSIYESNTMAKQAINKTFLAVVDAKTRDEILTEVANHYSITKDEALEEITHEEAEHLLDYLTGSVRTAVSVLLRRHGLVAS